MPSHALTAAETPAAHITEGAALPQTTPYIRYGTQEYQRAGLALFLAGFASFSLIYCVQPLLPEFAQVFSLTPAQSSLALSLTTGLLAVAILLAGAFSQALGRKRLMFASMMTAALLNLLASVAPDWDSLLAARALEGFILGGVPAVAMAWLAEEMDPKDLGKAMGLYVGGTAFGGMMGRVGMGMLVEYTSWRMAMGVLGGLCLLSAIGFLLLLPASRHFAPRRGASLHSHLGIWAGHLRNAGLLQIYAIGFIMTGIFVTLFNYATFRLSAMPYGLNQTQISFIFLVFAFGIVSSSLAGRFADRFGRQPVLTSGFLMIFCGVMLTLLTPLIGILSGIALVTIGFFICHSVTSSSIGPLAGLSKGHASALYLLFYYMGSSIVGPIGGWFWQHGGWESIVGLTALLALMGLGMSASFQRRIHHKV